MATDENATSAAPPARKKRLLTTAIVAGIMLLEGVGLYVAMKMLEPKSAGAAAVGGASGDSGTHGSAKAGRDGHQDELVELKVADIKAPWLKTGRTFVFEVRVAVRVRNQKKAVAEKALQDNEALVLDRISRVIRSAEPNYLEEDGLETIRRQMRHELNLIVGDESTIAEVLIPRFIKFRADY